MNIQFKVLLLVLLALAFTACAPQMETAGAVINNTVEGRSVVRFQANALDILSVLATKAEHLQPSAAHSFFNIASLGDQQARFSAVALGGSAVLSSSDAYKAEDILIRIEITTLSNGVEVGITGEPRFNSDVDRSKELFIELLDQNFLRL